MREVARLKNLLSGFVTTLKRLFESVVGTLFCLLLQTLHDELYCLWSTRVVVLGVLLSVIFLLIFLVHNTTFGGCYVC